MSPERPNPEGVPPLSDYASWIEREKERLIFTYQLRDLIRNLMEQKSDPKRASEAFATGQHINSLMADINERFDDFKIKLTNLPPTTMAIDTEKWFRLGTVKTFVADNLVANRAKHLLLFNSEEGSHIFLTPDARTEIHPVFESYASPAAAADEEE